MNARALNLLRYPRPGLGPEPGQLRAFLLAGLIGVLLGGLCSGWQHMRLTRLHGQREQLQAHVQTQATQEAEAAALREQDRLRRQVSERALEWHDRRQQLLHLHRAFDALADEPGLRVQRWQGDGRRLVLSVWLPRADAVPLLTDRLSAAWPQGWSLQSLGERPLAPGDAGGVEAVFEAPGPSAAAAPVPSRP
ncbi:MAG: hypothetical protein ACKOWC_08050 [Limnohabitans sp.]